MLDKEQSIWACYELGLMKFSLRKSYGHNNNKDFQEIYSQCIYNIKEKYNPAIKNISSQYLTKLTILEKRIYIPNTDIELKLHSTYLAEFNELNIQPLEYIIKETYPISFTIIDSSKGCFIIIPITWSIYILCEPIKNIYHKLNYKELYNYIIINYKDLILFSVHYIC